MFKSVLSRIAAALAALTMLLVAAPGASAAVTTEKVKIPIEGGYLDGTIMRPDGPPAPIVVMAPGLGGTFEGNPLTFARQFAANGMAILGFNYRNFGLSTGKQRRLFESGKQLRDWRAAIGYAKTTPGVDGSRMALWGTSMAGGHVLFLGTEFPWLKAVVSQVPHLDARGAIARQNPSTLAGIVTSTVADWTSAISTGAPFEIPFIGRPGSTALMTVPGAYEYYLDVIVRSNSGYVNRTPARSALNVSRYSPILRASSSKVPTQISVAAGDTLAPPRFAKILADRIGAELHSVPGEHFEVYTGQNFLDYLSWQIPFLRQKLGIAAPPAS